VNSHSCYSCFHSYTYNQSINQSINFTCTVWHNSNCNNSDGRTTRQLTALTVALDNMNKFGEDSADSFHMTGQTAHLVIKCTKKPISWICQKYWNLIENSWNSLENHWKQKSTILQIPQTNQCSDRAITLMQKLCAACKNKDKLWLQFILSNKHWCVLCPSKMLEHVFFCFLCILMHEMHNAYYTISTLNLHSIRYICKIIFLIQGLTFFKIYWNGSSFLLI